jgi:hypothetical protein
VRKIIAISSVDGDSALGTNALDQIEPAFLVLADGIGKLDSLVAAQAVGFVRGQSLFPGSSFLPVLIDPLAELLPVNPEMSAPVPLVGCAGIQPIVQGAARDSQIPRDFCWLVQHWQEPG